MAEILSRTLIPKIIDLVNLVHMNTFTHETYEEDYIEDEEFEEIF
jgi:hypothetical protein